MAFSSDMSAFIPSGTDFVALFISIRGCIIFLLSYAS